MSLGFLVNNCSENVFESSLNIFGYTLSSICSNDNGFGNGLRFIK